ncbi:MAG: glucans biosynthesis glucosyltransferase MdoH [Geminicoccaceae bacterium]
MSRAIRIIGPLRRLGLTVLVLLGTAAAVRLLASVLASDGLSMAEVVILVLFALTFAWISMAFWTAIAGFTLQLFCLQSMVRAGRLAEPSPGSIEGRTALAVPIYHEDPEAVGRRLAAIYRSLEQTGQLQAFDFFVLSDSQEADVVFEEETMWARLCAELGAKDRIFYRNRTNNQGRKAGNIAEFCRRWGKRYSYFVCLDADSLMTGETLVYLAKLMDVNPKAGLIQTSPQPIGGKTLFARIQQFASALDNPLFALGTAFWYPGRSNYWGHNAIIRTEAFMADAGLPKLPGKPPLGGEILSHDFVEAALLARSGWSVWLVPEVGGSFEELPPTLADYAQRDQRWCQGNLQHMRLLPMKGICAVNRMHLLFGVMSYMASVFWLVLLLLATLEAAWLQSEAWVYFPDAGSLFPTWPVSKTFEMLGLYSITMGMLFLPKFLALAVALFDPVRRKGFGGPWRLIKSTLTELFFSVLLAPIMMFQQTQAVLNTLLGRKVSWKGQRRGDGVEGWGDAASNYGAISLMGVVWALVAYQLAPALLAWMSPVLVGLFLAVPLAVLTSQPKIGAAAMRHGWFLTPEETHPPYIVMDQAEAVSTSPENRPADVKPLVV